MDRENECLQLMSEALNQLEQLLELELTLDTHHVEAGKRKLAQAQMLLKELRTAVPRALAAKNIARRQRPAEDNRKRLNRETQAVLNPCTALYTHNNVVRLYK